MKSAEASSTDEAVGSIEGKVVKAGANKIYKAHKLKKQKKENQHKNRLMQRGNNDSVGRKKKHSEDKLNNNHSKNIQYNKLEKKIIKGSEFKNKVTGVTNTLDGESGEGIDQGVTRIEGKLVKAGVKKGYHSYKTKKGMRRAKNNALKKKPKYSLNKNVSNRSASSKGSKSLQKKAIQKSYHYNSARKLSTVTAKKQTNMASKKLSNKVKATLKKAVSGVKTAVTSKVAIISGIALIFVMIIVFIGMLLMALFGGIASETAYIFTPEQATVIQQRYTAKEMEYLQMITNEAEDYVDDPNATIAYDPVGHEPHELLSLYTVLFLYEIEENDGEFNFNDEIIDEIADEIIEARYFFTKETEEFTRTHVIENVIGEDTYIVQTLTRTNLQSRTLSIQNMISGASYNTPQNTREFIDSIKEDAQVIAWENDLYASVMMAQAILETGSGSSGLSSPPHFNLFGIKGSYNGESVDMITEEDDGTGRRYTVREPFRSYPSYKESMEDYARVMLEQPRPGFYSGTYKSNTNSYRDATQFLQGRYATDTQYARKLNNIIEQHNLTQFDMRPPRSDSEESDENDERIILEREFGGNMLALTEYERDRFSNMLEMKGLMAAYSFPLEEYDWANNILEPYGITWNGSKAINSDGLLIDVPRNQNVQSPVSGRVESANSHYVRIRSEGTLVFEIENLQNVNVSRGSVVRRGDVIGRTTSDGLLINTSTARRIRNNLSVNPYVLFTTESTQPFMYRSLNQIAQVQDDGEWLRPSSGPVTSRFGPRISPGGIGSTNHQGIDFGGGAIPIWATRGGIVTTAAYSNVRGYYIVIDHGDEYRSLYQHMPSMDVSVGQRVEQGDQIGIQGRSGYSTGIHLHFEIHRNGRPINPAEYINLE